jgi:hypothetical protein
MIENFYALQEATLDRPHPSGLALRAPLRVIALTGIVV